MARIGIVVETTGLSAEVSMDARASCDSCSDHGSCGMGDGAPTRNQLITAQNAIGAKAGDTVEIDLPPRGELKLSFLVWVVPLIGLIGGAVGGALIHASVSLSQDIGTLLGATLGFALSYLVLRRIDRSTAHDPKLSPYIVKVVPAQSCVSERNEF
jgi:sigma-E factor negative regulatory protein RseC